MARIRNVRRRIHQRRGDRSSLLGRVASTLAGAFAVSTLLLHQDAQVALGFLYQRRSLFALGDYVQPLQSYLKAADPMTPPLSSTSQAVGNNSSSTCTKIEALQAQPREHPRAGARDACGNYGYIHDPRAAHNQFKEMSYSSICLYPLGQGSEGQGGAAALKKIQIANNDPSNKLRLLCVLYSMDTPDQEEYVKAVFQTWGNKCDGFMVASNSTKPSIGAVDIPHLGNEEYGTIWQKIRSTWTYVYDNYLEDYDFVYMAGVDTYVIVENLRQIIYQAHMGKLYKDPKWIPTEFREVEKWEEQYALNPGQERPLYLGAIYPINPRRYVCAGGAGYVLNRPAIRRLIQNLPYTQADTLSSKEDFYVAAALRNQSVACSDTRDPTGAWRFHHLDGEFQYNYKTQGPAPWRSKNNGLERTRGIQESLSLEGVSEHSVSFHLTTFKERKASPERLYRYHALLYGHCDKMKTTKI